MNQNQPDESLIANTNATETTPTNQRGQTIGEAITKMFPRGRIVPLDGIQFKVADASDDGEILLRATGFTKAGQKKFFGKTAETAQHPQAELIDMFGGIYDKYAQSLTMMAEGVFQRVGDRCEEAIAEVEKSLRDQMSLRGPGIIALDPSGDFPSKDFNDAVKQLRERLDTQRQKLVADMSAASQKAASDPESAKPGSYGGRQRGQQHGEGYCLMEYRSKDGAHSELIWNSRDGVTPFIVHSQDGQIEMMHVNWQNDKYLPNYKPKAGERIFVDLTPEKAREYAARRVDQYWDHEEYPLSARFDNREAAIEAFAGDMLSQPGQPDLLTITPELEREFASQELTRLSHPGANPSSPSEPARIWIDDEVLLQERDDLVDSIAAIIRESGKMPEPVASLMAHQVVALVEQAATDPLQDRKFLVYHIGYLLYDTLPRSIQAEEAHALAGEIMKVISPTTEEETTSPGEDIASRFQAMVEQSESIQPVPGPVTQETAIGDRPEPLNESEVMPEKTSSGSV